MTTPNNGFRTRRPMRRRGYILIVVLGLSAIVASLGWAFLDAHGTVMPEAMNRLAADRARYLAESGVALGTHFLLYPPKTVACGDYWHGGSSIAIDNTPDYTDVSVAQDATDPNLFAVTAMGVAHGSDGAIRGKHSITAKVIRPPAAKWRICQALLCAGSTYLPSTVVVAGDIHVNGWLWSLGSCQGDVSATSNVWWMGGGPPTSITPSADALTAPTIDPSEYETYSLQGNGYTAYSYANTDMRIPDATALNATDMSATNPGRIIVPPPGDFELRGDVGLTGTLVVDGDLSINGMDIQLAAVQNYPALVVTGNILFIKAGASLTVVGSVLCGGDIDDGNDIVHMDVTGSLVLANGFDTVGNGDTFHFTWDPTWSVFWDLEQTSDPQPMTLLDWKEN